MPTPTLLLPVVVVVVVVQACATGIPICIDVDVDVDVATNNNVDTATTHVNTAAAWILVTVGTAASFLALCFGILRIMMIFVLLSSRSWHFFSTVAGSAYSLVD